MANKGESSQPRSLSLEQAHKMRRDNVIIALQDQERKLTMELKRVKGSKRRPLTVESLIATPLIFLTPLLTKTIKSKVLEGEVHLEIILATSRLRHQSLMVASNQRITSIGSSQ